MKYVMIISSMVLGLAMPALAQDQTPAANPAQQEGVHAPTNRLDKLVPNMKAPGTESDQSGPTTTTPSSDDSSSSGAGSGEPSPETIHPPTNRVGKAVPNMKSPNATDDLPSEQPAESK